MKNKKMYYLCAINEYSVIELNQEEREKSFRNTNYEHLKNNGVVYLTNLPDIDFSSVKYSDDIRSNDVIKNNKLSDLVEDFLYDFDGDEETEEDDDDSFDEKMDARELALVNDYFIIRMDLKSKKMSIVNSKEIKNTIEIVENRIMNSMLSDYMQVSQKTSSIHPDYLVIFQKQILKCFGNNTKGYIYFANENTQERWDVNVVDGKVVMGINEEQNEAFPQILIELYEEGTVCNTRIFTQQKIDGLTATEIYSFVLYPDCEIENIPHDKLFEAYTTHHETGKAIESEPNVIYCDIYGGKTIN